MQQPFSFAKLFALLSIRTLGLNQSTWLTANSRVHTLSSELSFDPTRGFAHPQPFPQLVFPLTCLPLDFLPAA